MNKANAGADEEPTANAFAALNLRDLALMNAYGVLTPQRNVRGEAIGYKWSPEGKARWRELKKLLDGLEKKHRITDRAWLEDTVMAAALAYRHPSALSKDDVEPLLASMSKVTKALCEEGGARIASILMNRDHNLIKGRAWNNGKDDDEKRFDSMLELYTGLLFNPIPRTAPPAEVAKVAKVTDKLGLFDGWENSYERACAVRMRLGRIAEDLSQLEYALRRLPKTTRQADTRLHGAVAVLRNRWNEGPAGKVGMRKFIESVIAFVDPAAGDVSSALRHRLKGM